MSIACSPGMASESQREGATEPSSQASESESSARTDSDRSSRMREKTVSADELLSADVFNVANPVGNVRDLVLSEDGRSVEYILYEVPYPYAYQGARNGFVAFDNVALDDGMFGSQVRFDDETDQQAPETLEITRDEADERLLSRILDKTVTFEGDQSRPLEDVLIDRRTGAISGYVVNSNPDAWFNEDPRIIPPDQVTIGDQGEVSTTAEFASLETVESLQ